MNTLIYYYKKWFLIVLAILAGIGIRAYGQDTVMYRGGYADGYARESLLQFAPARLHQYVAYNGGAGDGYGSERLLQFGPAVLPQSVMYKGGTGDGYAFLEGHHFQTGYLDHYSLYSGAAGDGYSAVPVLNFTPGFLTQYGMYAGGSGDGYAGHLAVSYVPLPVDLLSFTGEMTLTGHALLSWSVADEKDAVRYELERSNDSKSFRTIHTQAVPGNTHQAAAYRHEDRQPLNGANYYRLRIFDKDGSSYVSNIILLVFKNGEESLSLFPNPATTSLQIAYRSAAAASIRMVNVQGSVVYAQRIAAGNHTLSVPLTGMAAGVYLLHVAYSNGEQRSIRFVKSN